MAYFTSGKGLCMIAYKGRVGVFGATSIIGECLLPLLVKEGWDVVAFTRQAQYIKQSAENQPIIWQLLKKSESPDSSDVQQAAKTITHWISLAPIWVLPEYFSLFLHPEVKHIVAVSSTSRFTKGLSSDHAEKELVTKLTEGEQLLIDWAGKNQVFYTILRPTLTYGLGRDKNVSAIARFIRRFSFFPLLGEARGLRQPLHAQDVALVCLAALSAEKSLNFSYNISGEETLSYREMVGRIFFALGKKPRFMTFPIGLFRLAILCLQIFPPFQHWSAAMVERMNQDLVFDHEEAHRDLNFSPRSFCLTDDDLPGFYTSEGNKNI